MLELGRLTFHQTVENITFYSLKVISWYISKYGPIQNLSQTRYEATVIKDRTDKILISLISDKRKNKKFLLISYINSYTLYRVEPWVPLYHRKDRK